MKIFFTSFSGDNSALCSARLVIPATRTANLLAATASSSALLTAPQPTMSMDSVAGRFRRL
jgi:hypothetical protein